MPMRRGQGFFDRFFHIKASVLNNVDPPQWVHKQLRKERNLDTLDKMSWMTLRYLIRHKDEYDKEFVEAAEVELMQRKLMGELK